MDPVPPPALSPPPPPAGGAAAAAGSVCVSITGSVSVVMDGAGAASGAAAGAASAAAGKPRSGAGSAAAGQVRKLVLKPRKFNVSRESTAAWLRKIKSVQESKVTPEMRERMKRRAVFQQSVMMRARKCKKMQSANRSVKMGFTKGLLRMRTAKNSLLNFSRAASAPAQQLQLQQSAMSEMSMSASVAARELHAVQEAMDDSDEDDDLFSPVANSAACAGAPPAPAVEIDAEALIADQAAEEAEMANELQASDMDKLLADLREEPDTDEERAAKFALYEVYLETVTKMREQTFAFWQESKSDFAGMESAGQPSNAVRAVETALRKIDRAHNMSLPDFDGPVWFVHGMCKKASQNSSIIDGVLRSIRTKLDLLSRQDECPICLERFGDDHIPQVLGCCHKVCDECWAHWKQVRHGRAFCPLCRADDFVSEVVGM